MKVRHRDRVRLGWSLLASAILNAAVWIAVSAHVSLSRDFSAKPEQIIAATSVRIEPKAKQTPRPRPSVRPRPKPQPTIVRIVRTRPPPVRVRAPKIRQIAQRPRARRESPAAETALMAPPPPATLVLPSGWGRQDFAYLGTTDTAEWLDSNTHSGKWIPHVFLWVMKVDAGYMRPPELQDAVKQILTSLQDNAQVAMSRSQQVCGGRRPGWFFEYVKPDDTPPLHFDETVFLAGDKAYRAMYIREVDQPEDMKTRDALNTLCWP